MTLSHPIWDPARGRLVGAPERAREAPPPRVAERCDRCGERHARVFLTPNGQLCSGCLRDVETETMAARDSNPPIEDGRRWL